VKNKYRMNFSEGEVPHLPYGTYLLEIRGKKDSGYAALHNYTVFHVSDLSTISWRENNTIYYKVTDRLSGKPVKKAEVRYTELAYDNKKNKEVQVAQATQKTDKNGLASFEVQSHKRVEIVVKNGDDVLDLHQVRYFNKNEKAEPIHQFAEVFTDRGIYRPGQVLHFKAIAIKSSGNGKHEV